MTTVAVLGTTGMLGNSVVQEFAKFDGELIGSARNKQTDERLAKVFYLMRIRMTYPNHWLSWGKAIL